MLRGASYALRATIIFMGIELYINFFCQIVCAERVKGVVSYIVLVTLYRVEHLPLLYSCRVEQLLRGYYETNSKPFPFRMPKKKIQGCQIICIITYCEIVLYRKKQKRF